MGRWSKDGAGLAEATLQIVDEGRYLSPAGTVLQLGLQIENAMDGTQLYRPHELTRLVKNQTLASSPTAIEVTTEGTAEAGRRLLAEGERDVAILNFASARSVGGGFLRGARAQEEDLCRASALYRCLETQPEYYDANRAHPDGLYTDHIVYSPRVPFFRGSDQELLEEPYALSVITAPAPCTREIVESTPHLEPAIREVFARRIAMVLAVARDRGHDCVVLGAWGCGAFRGDPEMVANAFEHALKFQFAGVFRRVIFAVLVAKERDRENYDVFSRLGA